MLEKLKHYLSVYGKFVSTSIQVETSFRTSFILLIFMDLFFFFSSMAAVNFIYDHVATIGPWDRNHLLFFLCFMLAIDNLHMMIFSQSFWELSFNIKTGQLDYTILKPMSTIFSVFFRHFRASSLFNTPTMTFFLIYYGNKIGLGWIDWVLLPFFLVLGLTLLVLIEFILSTSMFWVTEGIGINFLRMQMQALSRWPHFIYANMTRKVLTTMIPILLIGSAPVSFIYDKSQWYWIAGMLAAITVLSLILNTIWQKGLRNYDSASS